jgi:hypothetical protein
MLEYLDPLCPVLAPYSTLYQVASAADDLYRQHASFREGNHYVISGRKVIHNNRELVNCTSFRPLALDLCDWSQVLMILGDNGRVFELNIGTRVRPAMGRTYSVIGCDLDAFRGSCAWASTALEL